MCLKMHSVVKKQNCIDLFILDKIRFKCAFEYFFFFLSLKHLILSCKPNINIRFFLITDKLAGFLENYLNRSPKRGYTRKKWNGIQETKQT